MVDWDAERSEVQTADSAMESFVLVTAVFFSSLRVEGER
jgi:hypothetical protein